MATKYAGPNQTDPYPIRKLRVFVSGLRFAVTYNIAATYKIVVSVIVLLLSFFFREWVDLLIVLLATAQIITAELLNSAIEELCDYIQPEADERIGAIKDIAAAGAGFSMLIWLIVMIYQFGGIAQYFLAYGKVPVS